MPRVLPGIRRGRLRDWREYTHRQTRQAGESIPVEELFHARDILAIAGYCIEWLAAPGRLRRAANYAHNVGQLCL